MGTNHNVDHCCFKNFPYLPLETNLRQAYFYGLCVSESGKIRMRFGLNVLKNKCLAVHCIFAGFICVLPQLWLNFVRVL